MEPIDDLLALQAGVVSRRQALGRGVGDHDLRRWMRQRRLVVMHPGVLLSHTGPPTWLQRAWAATLAVAPAALSHDSALRAVEGPGRHDRDDGARIHVAVDRQRHVVAPHGVALHRIAHFEERVLWNASPPRVRAEEALIDLASEAASDWQAIERLAGAIQARMTTAGRLQEVLGLRERVSRRSFLDGVLRDLSEGACSVLEHGYLTLVERPHGLPRAKRQVKDSPRGTVYRDVEYVQHGALVELDGRLFHDSAAARDLDLDRDLDAAVTGRHTIRLGWGQVFDRPCLTAVRVGRLLQARGWVGVPQPCPRCSARSVAVTG